MQAYKSRPAAEVTALRLYGKVVLANGGGYYVMTVDFNRLTDRYTLTGAGGCTKSFGNLHNSTYHSLVGPTSNPDLNNWMKEVLAA